MRRVVVTGLGVVSPAGSTLETFWSALLEGRSAIGPVANIPTERLLCTRTAEVTDFRPEDHFDPRRLAMLDRSSQFGVVAARAAVADAGLSFDEALGDRTATIVGTGIGGQTTLDDSYLRLYGEGAARLHPLTIPRLMVNAPASNISMDLGLRGPAYAVASACASATHALGQAFGLIRSGAAPVALAGGVEACITVGSLKAWEALKVMSDDTCRPFSRNRSGMVLGEGAAMLVLEEREAAERRGAAIYAEIVGFGCTADARELTSPDVDGAARAMSLAMEDAGLEVGAVDYINAHGTGTLLNDRVETRAIRKVFGADADRLLVSSCKAVLGHGLGAAGGLEAAATALAIRHGVAPPTANFEEPDPECDLDYVPNVARPAKIRAALSNSFAFGGLNAVLAMGRA